MIYIMLFRKKVSEAQKTVIDERLRHIAFIMDGNGRWATNRMLPREYGHREGAKVFEKITEYCGDIGIKYVTVYAFSTENWKRPPEEVKEIMQLFRQYIGKALDTMMKRNIRIIFLGDKSVFDDETKALMNRIENESKNNGKTLNIAINYGARDEITAAVNRLIEKGNKNITEELIESELYTRESPPPDLIVRTGNERRLSNFLLWQAAYSELYFTDVLWPDFTEKDVDIAVSDFYSRKRRYGGV